MSGLERAKLEAGYEQLSSKIEVYRGVLADENKVLEIIKEDLIAIKNKYGDERRTEIAMVANEIDIEDLIDEEDVVITLTHNG